jgi:hypothetical protein
VLLGFEEFTARLLAWTLWRNTGHQPAPLRGKTPLEAWQDDPTPLRDAPRICGRRVTVLPVRRHPGARRPQNADAAATNASDRAIRGSRSGNFSRATMLAHHVHHFREDRRVPATIRQHSSRAPALPPASWCRRRG